VIKNDSQTILKKDYLNGGPFLFIGNPNSGVGGYLKFKSIFDSLELKNAQLAESTSKEHMLKLAREAKKNGYKVCVAVGGDGTVHGIASQLIGGDLALGIIPTGSGNGIARHLNISMDISTAIQQVLNGKPHSIDTITINGTYAIGFCGVGFDGYVAHLFDNISGRGFGNYIKLTLQAFQS